MEKIINYIGDAIVEVFDTVFYTMIFTFVYVHIINSYYEISYILFPVVPLFIVYSPFIKRVQKRYIIEIVLKTILYLPIALISFVISYMIFIEMFADSSITFLQIILLVFSAIALLKFIIRTLKFNSVPRDEIYYDKALSSKKRVKSFLFAAGAWIFTFEAFNQYMNPDINDYMWTSAVGFFLGFLGILVAVTATVFFVLSLFDRSKSI